MSGKSGKSGCDLNELLDRVVAVAPFRGTSGKLAERLGPGSWTSSLNHLRRFRREDRSEAVRGRHQGRLVR